MLYWSIDMKKKKKKAIWVISPLYNQICCPLIFFFPFFNRCRLMFSQVRKSITWKTTHHFFCPIRSIVLPLQFCCRLILYINIHIYNRCRLMLYKSPKVDYTHVPMTEIINWYNNILTTHWYNNDNSYIIYVGIQKLRLELVFLVFCQINYKFFSFKALSSFRRHFF